MKTRRVCFLTLTVLLSSLLGIAAVWGASPPINWSRYYDDTTEEGWYGVSTTQKLMVSFNGGMYSPGVSRVVTGLAYKYESAVGASDLTINVTDDAGLNYTTFSGNPTSGTTPTWKNITFTSGWVVSDNFNLIFTSTNVAGTNPRINYDTTASGGHSFYDGGSGWTPIPESAEFMVDLKTEPVIELAAWNSSTGYLTNVNYDFADVYVIKNVIAGARLRVWADFQGTNNITINLYDKPALKAANLLATSTFYNGFQIAMLPASGVFRDIYVAVITNNPTVDVVNYTIYNAWAGASMPLPPIWDVKDYTTTTPSLTLDWWIYPSTEMLLNNGYKLYLNSVLNTTIIGGTNTITFITIPREYTTAYADLNYFWVTAYNGTGDSLYSVTLWVTVNFPDITTPPPTIPPSGIPGFDVFLLMGASAITLCMLAQKKLKRVK